MDIAKKAKDKEKESVTPVGEAGTGSHRAGRRRAIVTVKGRVRLNLRRMGLSELFGKTMHGREDGPLEAWVTPDDELKLKAFRSNGIIDVKFEK